MKVYEWEMLTDPEVHGPFKPQHPAVPSTWEAVIKQVISVITRKALE